MKWCFSRFSRGFVSSKFSLRNSASSFISPAKLNFNLCRSFVSSGDCKIFDIKKDSIGVKVFFENQKSSSFSYFWLRDHCSCPDCLHPNTFQRIVDTTKIKKDIQPNHFSHSDTGISLEWNDGHKSFFSNSWLHEHSHNFAYQRCQPILWGSDIKNQPPQVSVDQILNEKDGLLRAIELVEKYGFVLIPGMPIDAKLTKEFIEKHLCFIRETLYGDFWDFTANLAMADTAYTNLELKPHTDGCYFDDQPGIQIFHLLEFDGVGGETTLVDGFKVAQDIKQQDLKAFQFLSETPIPFHYVDGDHYLHSKHTIFGIDDNGQVTRFTFNNDDRAPFSFDPEKTSNFYHALDLLLKATRDPANQYIFPMKPGTLVLIDNQRVLHGRLSFTGHRRLTGCYLNKEDFLSRAHITRKNLLSSNTK